MVGFSLEDRKGRYDMRRLLTAVVLCMSICLFGYTADAADDVTPQKTSSPFIKCTTCGQDFTNPQGLHEHYAAHPDHVQMKKSPEIKCSTCGQEFTTPQGLQEHYKSHPDHQAAPFVPRSAVIKCSTCGQEFTVQQGADAYKRAHPEHTH